MIRRDCTKSRQLCQSTNSNAHEVSLTESLTAIISRYGGRVVCEKCGEDIINEREVKQANQVLCRACADKAYYLSKSFA